MKDSVAAPKMLEALDGRLNSPPRLRVCSWCFLGQPQCFQRFRFFATSAVTRFLTTNSGTPPAHGCWRAMKSFSFAPPSMSSCIRRHARSFWRAQVCLGQGGLILLFVMINSAALVLQRETECQSCRWPTRRNKQHTRDQLASCLAKRQ